MGERTKEQATQLLIEHIEKLRILADELKQEHDIDVINLISKPVEGVPLSIFKTKKLSCLEIIVKYLKENQSKKYHEIALLLNSLYSPKIKKSCLNLAHHPYCIYGVSFVRKSSVQHIKHHSQRPFLRKQYVQTGAVRLSHQLPIL